MSERTSSDEGVPFLDDSNQGPETAIHKEEATALRRRQHAKLSNFKSASKLMILVQVLLFLGNAAWTIFNLQWRLCLREEQIPSPGGAYEPNGAPKKLMKQTWNLPIGKRSPFTDLDPAVADAAWATVNMGGKQGWLKVDQSKVDAMNQSSIEFSDGSGYLYGLDVFHQLHCLDFLRKKTILYHPLYPNVEEDLDIPVAYHIAHCIDSIRLSLQCHADVSLVPQRWADGWIEPWAIWTNQHQCRDFDAVAGWARDNFPDFGETLVHPELGVFISGKLNHSALPIWEEPHDDLPDFLNYGGEG